MGISILLPKSKKSWSRDFPSLRSHFGKNIAAARCTDLGIEEVYQSPDPVLDLPRMEPQPAAEKELNVSFGYQCRSHMSADCLIDRAHDSPKSSPDVHFMQIPLSGRKRFKQNGLFHCLSGAALGANATLANTKICNGVFDEEILPGLDSPHTFRRLGSSFSTSRLDYLADSPSCTSLSGMIRKEEKNMKSNSAPYRIENPCFLNADDIQMAGGAAGEDRVQAVCSEENGWLFCGIYDGFNGRDAADFLAGTLYENITLQLRRLEWRMRQSTKAESDAASLECNAYDGQVASSSCTTNSPESIVPQCDTEMEEFQQGVLKGLEMALAETEKDFLTKVEDEMNERPDLAMVGSCVLVVLMHGQNLYILNLGDSRAILATSHPSSKQKGALHAIQLTEAHVVDNEAERRRVLEEHPDDCSTISGGRVKGKLRVTRAFGAGFLKRENMNDSLMGILRARDLCSPPYISTKPFLKLHGVGPDDQFVVVGSDGLFDFFNNKEMVLFVQSFICENPSGDPAKYMLELLLERAAKNAGMTVDQLRNIPIGRRRKYHDDITIIIIVLGTECRTTSASTVSSSQFS